MTQLPLIRAKQATKLYAHADFVEVIKQVGEAILETARVAKTVSVNVKSSHENYKVIKALYKYGYRCSINRDPENGSDEITVSWE